MTLIVKIMGLTTFIWLSPLGKWVDTSFKKLKVYFPRLKKKILSTRYSATRTQRSSQSFQNAREFFSLLSFIHINYKSDYIHPLILSGIPLSFAVIFSPSPPAKLLEKMMCPLQQLWTVIGSSGKEGVCGCLLFMTENWRTLSCVGIRSCVCS